jgi:hypothetical protein
MGLLREAAAKIMNRGSRKARIIGKFKFAETRLGELSQNPFAASSRSKLLITQFSVLSD